MRLRNVLVAGAIAVGSMAGFAQVSGSGSTGVVPKFTGSSTIGNSVITESNGSIGIGTTNPQTTLDVNGSVRSSGTTGYNFSSNLDVWMREGYGLNLGVGGNSPTFAARFLNTSGTTLMTVRGDGNVGIGTANPRAPLQLGNMLSGTAESAYGGILQIHGNADLNSGANGIEFKSSSAGSGYGWKIFSPDRGNSNTPLSFAYRSSNQNWTELLTMRTDDGFIGIGTTNPISALTLAGPGTVNPNTGPQINYAGENLTFVDNAPTGSFQLGGIRMVQPTGYYLDRGNMVFSVGVGGGATLDAVTIQPPGNVGIGTSSPGAKLEVSGNIKLTSGIGASMTYSDGTVQSTAWNGTTCGGDYAESIDVTGDRKSYEPGDVLVVDPKVAGKFLKSSEPYATTVMGIYSTQPGLTGRRVGAPKTGEEVPMAMLGIVPTKVSTENGPIKPGDLLVTSSTPGYAMKATDRSRMVGALIGKALDYLDSGNGVIEVGIALQ